MTYFYLFETKDYIYCGQHRCDNNKDPMKDYYKGSGKKWTNYLKENGWWLINDFRNNVKKTILEIVIDDENKKVIGNVERFWIKWSKEHYGNKCLNISNGSKPNAFVKDFEKNTKETLKKYEQSDKGKDAHKKYEQSDKGKENHKRFEGKRPFYKNVNKWGNRNGWLENIKFPSRWTEEMKDEYYLQLNNKTPHNRGV